MNHATYDLNYSTLYYERESLFAHMMILTRGTYRGSACYSLSISLGLSSVTHDLDSAFYCLLFYFSWVDQVFYRI